MRELAELLNEMVAKRVIKNYAIFGAMAQIRYAEPVATLDIDVLVGVSEVERIDILGEIYSYCKKKGYSTEGEAILVGTWPVQFVPVFSDLTRDAMEQAETADFEGVPLRVVEAKYLAVIALNVGRAKDLARILALHEAGAVTWQEVSMIANQYGLSHEWKRFKNRFQIQ